MNRLRGVEREDVSRNRVDLGEDGAAGLHPCHNVDFLTLIRPPLPRPLALALVEVPFGHLFVDIVQPVLAVVAELRRKVLVHVADGLRSKHGRAQSAGFLLRNGHSTLARVRE